MKDKCMDGVEAFDYAVNNSVNGELTAQRFVPLDIVYEIINCMQNKQQKDLNDLLKIYNNKLNQLNKENKP